MQDKLFKVIKSDNKENISNSTQKEYFIKRRKSSDLTSVSFCPTDDMSITSENFFVPNEKKLSSYINNSNEIEVKTEENELDFFYGVEKYYRMISPEKFYEYKRTRNYLPKRNIKEKEEPKYENINIPSPEQNIYNNIEENDTLNKSPQINNNMFFFPMYGNICFYMYNNFLFNYINSLQKNKDDTIKEESKISNNINKNKNDTNIKEESKEEEIPKKNDDIEVIVTKKYDIKKRKYQNYNKNTYHKYSKEDKYGYKENHYNNKNYFGNENTLRRKPYKNWNNYIEDFKEGNQYKKFNDNNDRRRNKNYYENNFQRKKYYY